MARGLRQHARAAERRGEGEGVGQYGGGGQPTRRGVGVGARRRKARRRRRVAASGVLIGWEAFFSFLVDGWRFSVSLQFLNF
jgi:hypothetical protein